MADPDLSMLPDDVRAAARVTSSGEVEWRLSDALRAINALADAGLLLTGLDLRSYADGKTFEAPWTRNDENDIEVGRRDALAGVRRAETDEWRDYAEWVLISWTRASR